MIHCVVLIKALVRQQELNESWSQSSFGIAEYIYIFFKEGELTNASLLSNQ